MPKYFLRTESEGVLMQMMALLGDAPEMRAAKSRPGVAIAELTPEEASALAQSEVQVYEDFEFATFERGAPARRYWDQPAPMAPDGPSLSDVLEHVRAPEAWEWTRGEGVTIAIVDTGICGDLDEFPDWKRHPLDLETAFHGAHWSDPRGHGSMCATIAAATDTAGGRFSGIAPDASVIAARTTLAATDIYSIYDELIAARQSGDISTPLVISNSYGLYRCSPLSGFQEDHPYLEIVLNAIDEGIPVVFAAGNNHYDVLCNHEPDECGPTSIWAVNSHERILSVGTVNADDSNQDPTTPHANSSRGPGQWAGALPKPDCVAPTYGTVVWSCEYRQMDWWGTSGACPQVAGLAALLLSSDPSLTPAEIGDIVRETSRPTGAPAECVGHGVIDCEAAVRRASTVA